MTFKQVIETVGIGIDATGVAVIGIGLVVALGAFLLTMSRGLPFPGAYRALRHSLGRAILLGLELLVAADIIRTVAVEPTLNSVAVLAVIVLVRTFLSFSLEVELDGTWPWRRARGTKAADAD